MTRIGTTRDEPTATRFADSPTFGFAGFALGLPGTYRRAWALPPTDLLFSPIFTSSGFPLSFLV